jgi:hypothetical protein
MKLRNMIGRNGVNGYRHEKMTDLPDEVDPNLSDESKANLAQMLEFIKQRDQIPPEDRVPITNPDKYSFPPGMDDEGNLNVARNQIEPE